MATAADDNPFDELAIVADAMRKLGDMVAVTRVRSVDYGTDEHWNVRAHRNGVLLIGEGGTLKRAVDDMHPRATSVVGQR